MTTIRHELRPCPQHNCVLTAGAPAEHRHTRASRAIASGFSMIELVVVVAIVICVTAIALPTLTTVLTTAKLRGGMGDLSAFFQAARTEAVKKNTIKFVQFQVTDGRTMAYVDDGAHSEGLTRSATQVWLPIQFSKVNGAPSGSGAPPALDTTTMWGSNSSGTAMTTDPAQAYFSQTGVPCSSSGSTGVGYLYYFTYAGPLGNPSYAALGISPAGRIKAWYWNGTGWGG